MIKQLEDYEITEVMDLWLKTTITAHSFIPKKHWIDRYKLVKDEYLPISTTFIYKEDNVIKAFISIRNNSFIGALFVLEDCQRKGIGRQLMDHCKSLYPRLEGGVYIKNINAVSFYKHCGFMVSKEQINEDSGFMEYIMSWAREKNGRFT